jgi:putative DNA primase/helicase
VNREQLSQQLLSGLPEELRSIEQFLIYRMARRPNGRPGKVPQRYTSGRLLNTAPHSPGAWLSLSTALDLFRQGYGDGLGVTLTPSNGIVTLDLDDVICGNTLRPATQQLVDRMDTFAEISVSGRGLHLFVKGILPGPRRKCSELEVIDHGYVALTGHRWPGTRPDLPDRQAQLEHLYLDSFPPQPVHSPLNRSHPGADDQEVIHRLLAARNGDRVRALMTEGRASPAYSTRSEADFALARMIGWYSSDEAQIARIMRASALYRPERWDQGTYLTRTIESALALGYPGRRTHP